MSFASLPRGAAVDRLVARIADQDHLPAAELAAVRELGQLSKRETAVVDGLPKGSALWKVGNWSFQAEHVLSAFEREITWTDERMVVVGG